MPVLIADEIAPRVDRGTWNDANARGVACAHASAWAEAAEAFEEAASLASAMSDVASHEALALVLNNLAHARLRTGHVSDAIRHAQRVCSLRAALFGEDAIVVARARTDLAVLLVHAERANEGLALVRRALAAIEQSGGEEDARLIPVLENAARIAIAAAQPSTAEPYLLRLFALLDVHELPTDSATTLLSRIAGVRATGAAPAPAPAPARVTPPVLQMVTQVVTQPVLPIVEELVLLDSAPIVVQPIELELLEIEAPSPGASLDMIEMLPVDGAAVDDIFGSATIELVDTKTADDAPSNVIPMLPANASSPAAPTAPSARGHNVLGFAIEYGTPVETGADVDGERIVPPPTSTHIPTPDTSAPALTLHVPNDSARDRRPRRPLFRWG